MFNPTVENVIKALEWCASGTKGCSGCPVKSECKGTHNIAMVYATKLLKSELPRINRELPRIMTGEEILEWNKKPDRVREPIVVEFKDDRIMWYAMNDQILIPLTLACKTVRYWTGMPTEEQQKEVKWNA